MQWRQGPRRQRHAPATQRRVPRQVRHRDHHRRRATCATRHRFLLCIGDDDGGRTISNQEAELVSCQPGVTRHHRRTCTERAEHGNQPLGPVVEVQHHPPGSRADRNEPLGERSGATVELVNDVAMPTEAVSPQHGSPKPLPQRPCPPNGNHWHRRRGSMDARIANCVRSRTQCPVDDRAAPCDVHRQLAGGSAHGATVTENCPVAVAPRLSVTRALNA